MHYDIIIPKTQFLEHYLALFNYYQFMALILMPVSSIVVPMIHEVRVCICSPSLGRTWTKAKMK